MEDSEIDLFTKDDDVYAKLTIPTQADGSDVALADTGIASKGTIDEREFERYVGRLSVYSNRIEFGIYKKEGTSQGHLKAKGWESALDRTIRVSHSDITDVRYKSFEHINGNYPGFAFETETDLYEIKFAKDKVFWPSKVNDDPIRKAISIIENNMGGPSSINEESEVDHNTTDELERLANLYEKGALTENEFETLKSDLID